MTDDSPLVFSLPAISRKKVTAAFDGGRLSSDSGVTLLALASWHALRKTEFASIRLHLLKIAGRIVETESRIRVALASCCPEAELFSLLAFQLQKSGP